ncbi:hypothetical protein BJ875DRAFT_123238 [Amylocarpus encephaloides]|uniref:NAD(P)-binding protein n=1 Tax=Amylocarpus encephaloides TaxID=45428 RepID=A0A9P7YDP9_9HELO|nr:hypothetical protein BJ875DRAFT_123238 [Amylocarpus encephaloides]
MIVGGTSGIGEFTLKAFVQNTISPRVYIVGRSAPAAERIIEECKSLNADGKVEFIPANVTELAEVDRVCQEIENREKKINLLVQSQGNLTFAGRNETPEGLDRKMTLNFYSRMRFIHNLRPLLRNATTSKPHFASSLSILGAGYEMAINLDDLELKNAYSTRRCADTTTLMNSFMTNEFASREPTISFSHSNPSIVKTGLARELPLWARGLYWVIVPFVSPFMLDVEECGQRQLFIATSGIYPPAKLADDSPLASRAPIPKGLSPVKGGDRKVGSGGYLASWNCEPTGRPLLDDYRAQGVSKTIWEHTMGVFDKAATINQERNAVGSTR